jgi:Domain of unknown function (DUF4440)
MRLVLFALFVSLCASAANASQSSVQGDATSTQIAAADQSFVDAVTQKDSAKLAKLLHDDFSWTNSKGKTLRKSEVLANVPVSADAATQERQVRIFASDSGGVLTQRLQSYTFRVWLKQGSVWRILLYQEVNQLASAPIPREGKSECDNPCKTLPYEPKNDTERAVIASWQALESAVTAHDSATWAKHVADDFTQITSNSARPLDKTARMKIIDEQRVSGAGSAPPPLARADFDDLGATVVMRCVNHPPNGKEIYVTRVWVERNGVWLLSFSFQTTVQAGNGYPN